MKSPVFTGTLLALLLAAPAWSQDADPDIDFDLPGADTASLPGDGGLDLDGVTPVANPLVEFFGNWPEDLVLAPIPGLSPQMGWNLTLAGGYFLGERSEDAPPPSVVGGFGMIAENGSYMYGGGASSDRSPRK